MTGHRSPGCRIDYDEQGNLDDVAIENVSMFRLEYMDDGIIWLKAYRDNGRDVTFWLTARGNIKGRHDFE